MSADVRFEIVEHAGEAYLAAVRLRDDVLTNPMGMVTTPEEMAAEAPLTHVTGFNGSEVCATCVLVRDGRAVRMKRVAVVESAQSQGIGTAMLRFCEAFASKQGADEIYAHARQTAVRFYEKAGYVGEGDYFDEVGIPHLIVRKAL
ncbi:MAG: GNAT family N-acetyltransferase [Polyangiales bacterium]